MSEPDPVTSAPLWIPWGAMRHDGLPELGAFVAMHHAVWQVSDILPLDAPRDSGTGTDAEDPAQDPAVDLVGMPSHRVLLAPLVGALAPLWADAHEFSSWWCYPSPHYPLCSQCGEPAPCRTQLAQVTAETELRHMHRFETTGICPACDEPVTRRQRKVTYPVNLEVPLGPPVTFHMGRRRCRDAAFAYARRCATGPHGDHVDVRHGDSWNPATGINGLNAR